MVVRMTGEGDLRNGDERVVGSRSLLSPPCVLLVFVGGRGGNPQLLGLGQLRIST